MKNYIPCKLCQNARKIFFYYLINVITKFVNIKYKQCTSILLYFNKIIKCSKILYLTGILLLPNPNQPDLTKLILNMKKTQVFYFTSTYL